MPPRVPAQVRIEATVAGNRQVVRLYVNGLRFELEAPNATRARQLALAVAEAFGLEDIDG